VRLCAPSFSKKTTTQKWFACHLCKALSFLFSLSVLSIFQCAFDQSCCFYLNFNFVFLPIWYLYYCLLVKLPSFFRSLPFIHHSFDFARLAPFFKPVLQDIGTASNELCTSKLIILRENLKFIHDRLRFVEFMCCNKHSIL
jgi:hypothetical protein